jgi:energy-coupling factor transporter ATP-binding protein EcfA2
MSKLINILNVSRFRSLREVTAGPFGQVNLITGRNNSGKSSILEAIRILVTDGAPNTLQSILNYREENRISSLERDLKLSADDTVSISNLFYGFPSLDGCSKAFTIEAKNENNSLTKKVSIGVKWYLQQFDPEQGKKIIEATRDDMFAEVVGVSMPVPMLEINASSRRLLVVEIDRLQRSPIMIADDIKGGLTPCVYIDPSSRATSYFGNMWDFIALTESEKDVVVALKIISPEIEGVSMVGGGSDHRVRTAIVKSKNHASPIALRTFGDGINRLFSIILSLVRAKGGVLLIDEIENGLHYSIQSKVWQVIFEMSRRLNVQVFATTHSWDCIESFQVAANSDEAEGVLVRLTAKGDTIIPTLFRENELAIAAKEQIEIR